MSLPPGITNPQSCNINAVIDPSLSTRTTPWLNPVNDNIPRPLDPLSVRRGLRTAIVSVSEEYAHGHRTSGLKPRDSNAAKNASHADKDPEIEVH